MIKAQFGFLTEWGDAEVLTKIPQGTSSHEWAPEAINYFGHYGSKTRRIDSG
jgi:hypothetical protein